MKYKRYLSIQTMKYKTYLSTLISIVNAKQQFLILIYILIDDSVNTSDRPEYNTIGVTDTNLEKITIQSNFKYYQNHDFHKLAQETDSKTVLGLYILIYVLCVQTLKI